VLIIPQYCARIGAWNIPKKRYFVPTFNSYQSGRNNVHIKIKPMGIRRYIPIFPYFTGSKVKVRINARNYNDGKIDFGLIDGLFLIPENGIGRQVTSDEIQISMTETEIGLEMIAFIAIPGHYCLESKFVRGDNQVPVNLLEFYAQSKDLVFTDWGIRLILLAIGGILGWVLSNIKGLIIMNKKNVNPDK